MKSIRQMTRPPRLTITSCLAAFLVFSLFGCGGGSSSNSSAVTILPQGFPESVYVPTSCQGRTITTFNPRDTKAPDPDPNPLIVSADQLELLDLLVSTISDVYLYPDIISGQPWTDAVAASRTKVDNGLETEPFYAEMGSLVTALGDEHSHFESPSDVVSSEAALAGANSYTGIGVLVKPLLNKESLTILSIFPDSSAEHGGLKLHDSILSVDGVPLVENGTAYPERVRGPECSAAILTVQSPGEAQRDVPLIRYRITSGIPIEAQLVNTSDGSRIGYIFIPTFYDETIPTQIQQALEGFGTPETLDGLILDNRMNGGGSSTVVEPILSYFTVGTLGHFVSQTASPRPLEIPTADPIFNSQDVPLVVIVGEDTVSFGEIFSGALQNIGRAQLVGKTTLGNVEVLHGYNFLIDGSRVWIAEERFNPINSSADWEKDGIVPDVVAYADWETITFETDPSVTAAVQLLGYQRAEITPSRSIVERAPTIRRDRFPEWRPVWPPIWPAM